MEWLGCENQPSNWESEIFRECRFRAQIPTSGLEFTSNPLQNTRDTSHMPENMYSDVRIKSRNGSSRAPPYFQNSRCTGQVAHSSGKVLLREFGYENSRREPKTVEKALDKEKLTQKLKKTPKTLQFGTQSSIFNGVGGHFWDFRYGSSRAFCRFFLSTGQVARAT